MEQTRPVAGDVTRGAKSLSARAVVLIDDHPVVALGIRLAFQDKQNVLLAGVATSPSEAAAVIERIRPEIVISDLVFGGTVEIGLIRACRRVLPSSTLVVFSSLPQAIYGREVFEAGADQFVPKDQPLEALFCAIEEIDASGNTRAQAENRDDSGSLPKRSWPGALHLTRREDEIGRRLSVGLSVARIGQDLGLSANTVAVHRDNIRKKLSCRDSAELIARLARLYPAEIGDG